MSGKKYEGRSPRISTDRPRVYLVGVGLADRPYAGRHPGGHRYEAFRKYLPIRSVPVPQARRYYSSSWGWRLECFVGTLTKPDFSVAAALVEASAALHMLPRRGAVYHAVRGELDVCFLPRVARATQNYLLASFHEIVDTIAYYIDRQRIAAQLHGVILLSECQRCYFEQYLPPERIFVVHHGVDTEFFRPAESFPIEPLCISVGSHMRDPKTLAAAMELVWRVNPKVRLFAIGTRAIKDSVPPPSNDERLVLLDGISDADLLCAYQTSALAILSVTDAVANNALLEQMACGLPVVATDVGAVREYLGHEAGLLVPKGDAEALASSVLRLIDDEPARRRMAAAARSRALTFDHRVVAERLMQVYRQVEALQ